MGKKSVVVALHPGLVRLASEGFQNELLVLFGFPSGSAGALLGGELPLRYCSGKFACRVPTWGLPARGHVQGLSLLDLLALARFRVLSCLAWLVVLGCFVAGELLGALSEFDYAGKLQQTGFVRMVPRFRGCIRVMRLMVLRLSRQFFS